MSESETTVEGVTSERIAGTEQFDTERSFLRSFLAELSADDVIWVVGAREGAYAALGAAVVGTGNVTVFDDDPERRERLHETLVGAGHGGVRVAPLSEMTADSPEGREDPGAGSGDREAGNTGPGTGDGDERREAAVTERAGRVSTGPSPSVVVLDEPASGGETLERLSLGDLLGVRYLLVKGASPSTERRLERAGYETSRLRGFDPLRSPWDQVVEARRDPDLPVKPVVSGRGSGAGEGRAGRLLGTLLSGLDVDHGGGLTAAVGVELLYRLGFSLFVSVVFWPLLTLFLAGVAGVEAGLTAVVTVGVALGVLVWGALVAYTLHVRSDARGRGAS